MAGGDEQSLQGAERQDLGARTGEFTLVEHFEVRGLAVEQAADEAPQCLGESHEGPHHVGHFAGRHVHGEGHEVPGEGELHLLGDGDARLVLRLGGRGAEVRYDYDRGKFEQRRLSRRLLLEDVQRRALDVAALYRRGEVGLVHDAPARDVDDAHALLGLFQRLRVEEIRGLLVLGKVNRDEVALGEQGVEVHQFDAHVACALLGDVGVKGDDPHAKGHGALRDQGPDLAQTNDAEGLAVQFDTLPLAALPLAVLQRRVRLGDVASLGEQQRHGLLGRREDVRDRRVDHHDAQFGRLGDVDVVQADPGAPDHDHVLGGLERGGVDVGRRTDDQRVRAHDGLEKLLGRQPELDVDLVTGVSQFLKAGVGNLFCDKYSRHL